MVDAWVRAWKNHEGNRKESFCKKYRALKMDRIKEDIVMNILNLLSSFYNFSLTALACARQRNSRAMIMQYLPLTWKEFCVNPMIDTSYVHPVTFTPHATGVSLELCFRNDGWLASDEDSKSTANVGRLIPTSWWIVYDCSTLRIEQATKLTTTRCYRSSRNFAKQVLL